VSSSVKSIVRDIASIQRDVPRIALLESKEYAALGGLRKEPLAPGLRGGCFWGHEASLPGGHQSWSVIGGIAQIPGIQPPCSNRLQSKVG